MQLTPRHLLMQFGHVFQQCLFALGAELGEMSPQLRLIASVMAMTPVQGLLAARRASTGRPAEDRAALAAAFVGKAVLNLPTTRSLIAQLKVDAPLRRLCGWQEASHLPDESTFSRAFAEFAATALPQQLHAALIESTQKQRLIGHIARDSTAIMARERFPEPKPAVAVRPRLAGPPGQTPA